MTASDFERFDDGAYRAVVLAERLARQAGRALAGPEDLLVALSQTNLEATAVLSAAGATPDALAARVAEWEGSAGAPPVAQAHFSPSLHRALQRAGRFASQERRSSVTGLHLLRGLIDGEDEVVWRILLSLGIDPGALVPALSDRADAVPARAAPRSRGAWSVLTAVWRT